MRHAAAEKKSEELLELATSLKARPPLLQDPLAQLRASEAWRGRKAAEEAGIVQALELSQRAMAEASERANGRVRALLAQTQTALQRERSTREADQHDKVAAAVARLRMTLVSKALNTWRTWLAESLTRRRLLGRAVKRRQHARVTKVFLGWSAAVRAARKQLAMSVQAVRCWVSVITRKSLRAWVQWTQEHESSQELLAWAVTRMQHVQLAQAM